MRHKEVHYFLVIPLSWSVINFQTSDIKKWHCCMLLHWNITMLLQHWFSLLHAKATPSQSYATCRLLLLLKDTWKVLKETFLFLCRKYFTKRGKVVQPNWKYFLFSCASIQISIFNSTFVVMNIVMVKFNQ